MLAIFRTGFLLSMTILCTPAYGKDCSIETGTGEVPTLPVNPTKEQILLNAKALATCQTNGFTETFNALNSGNAAEQEAARQALILNYSSASPPETGYYSAGVAIEQQAADVAPTTDVGQDIYTAQISRPVFTINPDTDPLFRNFDDISTLSTSLVDGNYQGCVELPVGTDDGTVHEQQTCHVEGYQEPFYYSCQRDLDVACARGSIRPAYFNESDFTVTGDAVDSLTGSRGGRSGDTHFTAQVNRDPNVHDGCNTYTTNINFTINSVDEVDEFYLDDLTHIGTVVVQVNGQEVYNSSYRNTQRCSDGNDHVSLNDDIKSLLISGSNIITVVLNSDSSREFDLEWVAIKKDTCDVVESFTTTCPAGENTGYTFLDSTCIGSTATQTVDQVPITRDCWAWSDQYMRYTDAIYTPEAACALIEQDGCGQVSSECISNNGVICTDQLITYDCVNTTSAEHVSLCGEAASACPDGNCTEEYQTWSDSTDPFLHANVAMESVAEVVKAGVESMNPGGTFLIFTGNGMNCDKGDLGAFDCCQDSGWANGLGLTSCSSQEQTLGMAKEAGQTHYVGEYCSSEQCILGACWCMKHSRSYCVYPSKLARMIMEQSNLQLGRNYGTPENPVCDGLSLTQFETIDMGTMDFSEFNNDIMEQFNAAGVPASSQMMQQMEDQISDMTGN